MLTIKKPMTLQTNTALISMNKGFCQRLLHGYSLMTARIAPKDLLFLLTAPMEFPEDLGNNTSLNLQNNFTDVRQVTIDVVNHIVNRIMLEQYSPFTYQDQVYITTALQKLGVGDVQYFMDEVRTLRKECNHTANLHSLYEKTFALKSVERVIAQGYATLPARDTSVEATSSVVPTPRYYLHETIYNRLQTGDVYSQVLDFQTNQLSSPEYIDHKIFLLSQQRALTQNISIEQYKNKLFHQEDLTLHYRNNHFETGEQLPIPTTEEEVLGQAAGAALYGTISQVMIHVLAEGRLEKQSWIPLDHNLAKSAENILNRYEFYHSEQYERKVESKEYQQLYQDLRQEELMYLQELSQNVAISQEIGQYYSDEKNDEFPTSPEMSHLTQYEGDALHLEEQEHFISSSETIDIAQITEQILQKTMLPAGDVPSKPKNFPPVTTDFLEAPEHPPQEIEQHSLKQWTMLHQLEELRRELVVLQQEEFRVPEGSLQFSLTQVQSVVESVSAPLEQTLLKKSELIQRQHSKTNLEHDTTLQQHRESLLETKEIVAKKNNTSQMVLEKNSQVTSSLLEEVKKEFHTQEGGTTSHFSTTERLHPQHFTEYSVDAPVDEAKRQEEVPSHILEETPSVATAVELLRETRRQIERRVEQASGVFSQENPLLQEQSYYNNNTQEVDFPLAPEGTTAEENIVALEKQLDLLDRENRIKLEQLKEISTHSQVETVHPRPVDSKRTMNDALRALVNPHEVISKLKETQSTPPEKRELPQNVEWILQQAAPATRELYESIINYQQNPEIGGNNSLKPANLAHFQGDIQNVQNNIPVSMDHVPLTSPEQRPSAEENGKQKVVRGALDDLPRKQSTVQKKGQSPWQKTSIVFKKEGNTMVEEWTEWLDSRQTQSVQQETTEQVVQKQTTTQTYLQEESKEIITQSAQDISELVNSTLSRQMSTITDQVYQQMERKLQQERSRRGRM